VPWGFGVMIATWTLALTLGGQKLWTAPVGLVMYLIGVAAIKMDPHFFDVLKEHIQTKGYYGV
jgi:type IV secretory pathway TrbD component